jgi:hypothetical protein
LILEGRGNRPVDWDDVGVVCPIGCQDELVVVPEFPLDLCTDDVLSFFELQIAGADLVL